MVWLTWRQFRVQAAVAVIFLAAAAVVLGITGSDLRDLYNSSGAAACKAHGPSTGSRAIAIDCATAYATLLSHESLLRNLLGPLLLAIPVITGIFWGAPLLARELENGTYRLAWTQSVTRARWLATKIAIVGLASIAVAELFSLMVSWWFSPIDSVNANRLTPGVFDERGIVAIGYAAFAFALAVTAGALIRRTLPAMATTLVAFIGARLIVTYWIRPHLIGPAHTTTALQSASNIGFEGGPLGATFVASNPSIPNTWVVSSRIVDAAGRAPTAQSLHGFLRAACPNIGAPPGGSGVAQAVGEGHQPASEETFQACINQLSANFHLAVAYQPANRYWPLQGYETAIFVGTALVLVGLCFWWVRRRLS
jgi:ABC-type transport system involved in multi-copper enzyme maturation permease subunit